ncbi:amino acid ABC transporter permease [uncultured Pseudokineococcus sp.]|uniref:amino acid ABC transporter permease n=1 Tax=uncultured Pseudokineococcus sp. TaxID=1642928 RepID=UPI0026129BB8|nr:amino acid ABC transporter permease [uncultured Pseudokineococcus sp.]
MSQPNAVLFDELGPRGRRRVRVLTVASAAVLAVVLVLAVVRLAQNGQFAYDLWAPLVDPTTDEFPLVWQRLGRGLLWTLAIAAVAMAGSLVIGVVIAVARLSLGRYGRLPLVAVVELFRGLPVVVTILYVSIALPILGVDLSDNWFLAIGLVVYNCVVISEIVRAGVLAVPHGQVEAGQAVGLRPSQVMRSIQLPQAFRSMLPAIISQLVVILKDTALGAVVLNGVTELTRQGQQLRNFFDNALQTFFVVAVIYIVVNILLGKAAERLERRLSRSRTASAVAEEEEAVRV